MIRASRFRIGQPIFAVPLEKEERRGIGIGRNTQGEGREGREGEGEGEIRLGRMDGEEGSHGKPNSKHPSFLLVTGSSSNQIREFSTIEPSKILKIPTGFILRLTMPTKPRREKQLKPFSSRTKG
jgi:hypothetical protein